MGAGDIEIDLTSAALNVAITSSPFTVGITSSDALVSILPAPNVSLEVTSQNVRIALSSVNFDVSIPGLPQTPDVDLGAAGDFNVDITCPGYDINVVQPNLILSNTALAEGPQGPPGLAGATGADSTVPGPPGATGPAGSTGPVGNPAYTTTSASLTVPPVGNTTTVNVADASWIAVGEMVYLDQAGGGVGKAGALQVTAKSGNQLTLLTPIPPAAPSGSAPLQMIWGETPGGTVDGANKSFTSVSSYRTNLISIFLNGIRQRRINDYTETGSNSFQFVSAPIPGDILSIDYILP